MKNKQLMDELEKSLDDKIEKERLMEGFLGYIICSTQVCDKFFAVNWTSLRVTLLFYIVVC